MTNNTSTFTPSTQILEAGEKAQALADAGKTLKPFLPQEAQQAVEGIDKVAQAFTATGRALEHFGFDEAEDLVVGQSQTSEFNPIDQQTDTRGPALSMGPQFDVGDDPAMETLKTGTKVAIKGLEKGMQGPVRAVIALPGVIHGYADKENISKSPIEEINKSEDKTKAAVYHALSPVTTVEEELLHHAQKTAHDPNASVGEKILASTAHAVVFTATKTVLAPVALVEQGFRWITSWFDEDEGFDADRQAFEVSAERRAAVFGSDPEVIMPLDSQATGTATAADDQSGPLLDSLLGSGDTDRLGDQDASSQFVTAL